MSAVNVDVNAILRQSFAKYDTQKQTAVAEEDAPASVFSTPQDADAELNKFVARIQPQIDELVKAGKSDREIEETLWLKTSEPETPADGPEDLLRGPIAEARNRLRIPEPDDLSDNVEEVAIGCQEATRAPVTDVPYPPELAPLIASGQVVYDPFSEHWVIKRCRKCGEFRDTCCGDIRTVSVVLHGNQTLTSDGKQALGIIPIKRPEPPKPAQETWKQADWWAQFKSVDELQGDGNVQWIINNVIPAGVTVVSAMPKDGKSFLALSFVKAITTGQAWLGRVGFEVAEPLPVLWLAAESGDSGLKVRCEKFNITKDKSRFICRTLTQGMVSLDDQNLERLIRSMKPYIVLETLVRFGDGEDEDDAKEASRLAASIFRLISLGARGVLAIHHSRKDLKRGGIDLEKSIRGSGDYAAMADAIWVIVRDESLYDKGKGVNEVTIQGWGRDFNPYPMRLALTKKAPKEQPASVITFAPGIVSILDETGDLGWVSSSAKESADQNTADILERMVQEDPTITLAELAKQTSGTVWAVSAALKGRGWSKPPGRTKKGEPPHQWKKTVGS